MREVVQGTEKAKYLLTFPAMGQDEDDVLGVHHAEIAVHGPRGIENVGPRARRVEGAGDLLANVCGLAGARDGDSATTGGEEPNGFHKGGAEPVRNLLQGGGFRADNLPAVFQTIKVWSFGGRIGDLEGEIHGWHPCRAGGLKLFAGRN